jgi:protein required for attachment to host cells
MRLAHNSLVLVADGAKMLLFRNEGDAEYPTLKVVEAEQQADPADRDIKTDSAGQKPGAPGAGGGSTAGEADFHQQAEDRFAVEAADRLKRGALAGDYDKLVVVAPPRTLGMLRKHYHSEVEKRLILELPKDLTGHPVDKIEQILGDQD